MYRYVRRACSVISCVCALRALDVGWFRRSASHLRSRSTDLCLYIVAVVLRWCYRSQPVGAVRIYCTWLVFLIGVQ